MQCFYSVQLTYKTFAMDMEKFDSKAESRWQQGNSVLDQSNRAFTCTPTTHTSVRACVSNNNNHQTLHMHVCLCASSVCT